MADPFWIQGLGEQGETEDFAIRLGRERYGRLQEVANLRNWTVPELLYRCLCAGLEIEEWCRTGRTVWVQSEPGSGEVKRVVIDPREV